MIFPQTPFDSDPQGSDSKLDSSDLGSVHFSASRPIGRELRSGLTGPENVDVLAERLRQLQAKILDLTDSDATGVLSFKQQLAIGPDSISGYIPNGLGSDYFDSWCNTPVQDRYVRSKDALFPSQHDDRSPLVGIDQSETDSLLINTSEEFSIMDQIGSLTARVSDLEQEILTIVEAQRPIIYVEHMHNNPGGISQSISGSNNSIHGGLQAALGNDNLFKMESTPAPGAEDKGLSQVQVSQLLKQLTDMIHQHELPADSKDEALLYLEAVKKAAEKEEPNKTLMAVNLKGVTEGIQAVSKGTESVKSLWTNIEPILSQLSVWLGVANDSFGF